MNTKWTIGLILMISLPLSSSALVVSKSYTSTTYDNDNSSGWEDAWSSTAHFGQTGSVTVDTVGSSSGSLGYRHYGGAAGRGTDTSTGDINQYIRFTTTWTVEAESWEEYSINITPQALYRISLWDENNSENDDSGVFPTLATEVRINNVLVSDTLGGLSGASRTTHGASDYSRSDAQTFSGYTGNNTFSLYVYGTITVNPHQDTGLFDDETEVAVLWGKDMNALGTVPGLNSAYPSTAAENADGLFIDASVTLNAVPEPASVLMIGLGAGILGVIRRFGSRV